MANRKRVDWTDQERDKWLRSSFDLLKQNKFKPPVGWQGLSQFMKIVKQAQVVLDENRRRNFGNIDSIKVDVPRFIEAGFLPENVWTLKKGGGAPPEPKLNPLEQRLNQVADERDSALAKVTELEDQNNGLADQNLQLRKQLQAVPSEAEVLKKFVADILTDVQERLRAIPGPRMTPVPPQPPAETLSRPGKHNPFPELAGDGKKARPNILLVGCKQNARAKYTAEFQEDASLRFWHSDTENPHQLKAMLPKQDMVFVHLNDVGHESTDLVNQAGRPFQRVQGADSSMMDQIRGYLERRKREVAAGNK